jgi:hypothetical protein
MGMGFKVMSKFNLDPKTSNAIANDALITLIKECPDKEAVAHALRHRLMNAHPSGQRVLSAAYEAEAVDSIAALIMVELILSKDFSLEIYFKDFGLLKVYGNQSLIEITFFDAGCFSVRSARELLNGFDDVRSFVQVGFLAVSGDE